MFPLEKLRYGVGDGIPAKKKAFGVLSNILREHSTPSATAGKSSAAFALRRLLRFRLSTAPVVASPAAKPASPIKKALPAWKAPQVSPPSPVVAVKRSWAQRADIDPASSAAPPTPPPNIPKLRPGIIMASAPLKKSGTPPPRQFLFRTSLTFETYTAPPTPSRVIKPAVVSTTAASRSK